MADTEKIVIEFVKTASNEELEKLLRTIEKVSKYHSLRRKIIELKRQQ